MINKIKRYKKITKDLAETRRMIKKVHLIEPHEIRLATLTEELGDDILEAQKLHAAVFLKRGFVDETEVENGIITKKSDPHQQHSLYFVVRKLEKDGRNPVVATARQIQCLSGKGFLSFPLVEKADINLHMLKELVGYDPEKCVEISGLAKQSGTPSATILLLYRAMWHHSLREKHQLWIMACDVRLYQKLRILFGPAIKKIGKETDYKGGAIIPAMLNPQEALSEFIRISRRRALMFGISRKILIGFFVRGLPRKLIPAKSAAHLDSVLGSRHE